jgi:hypothetical protein
VSFFWFVEIDSEKKRILLAENTLCFCRCNAVILHILSVNAVIPDIIWLGWMRLHLVGPGMLTIEELFSQLAIFSVTFQFEINTCVSVFESDCCLFLPGHLKIKIKLGNQLISQPKE